MLSHEEFVREIAEYFCCDPDDIGDAVDLACVTQAEWRANPDACAARINGALEEEYAS